MSLKTSVSVTKVQDVKTDDNFVTITLKGSQPVVLKHHTDGFDVIDEAEITMTVKFKSLSGAKHVGIGDYGANQVLTLSPRDESLEVFIDPAIPERDKALDDYRGKVPDEALDTIENAIPEHILKKIV